MDMYRQQILDHYKNPRNFGHLDNPHAVVSEENVSCGDRISMEVIFEDDTSVKDIRFFGEGCAISQASASMLTERVKGMKKDDIMKLSKEEILEMLGTNLTPSRIKCAVLPLQVLHKAVQKEQG